MLHQAKQIEVLRQFAMTSTMSIRQAAEETGITRESVRKKLKLHKFHPYNLQITEELGVMTQEDGINCCEFITNRIIALF